MKGLRTVASALAILTGATLVVAWLAAGVAVHAVNDEALAGRLTRAALADPEAVESIGALLEDEATSALSASGVDLEALGLRDPLHTLMTRLVGSEVFERLIVEQVDTVHTDLRHELARDGRPEGPLLVTVDVSAAVSDLITDIPVVGGVLPTVALDPVDIELVPAAEFEQARGDYRRLELARAYFLWAGLVCFAGAFLVSTRRRFVLAKILVAAGAIALVGAAVVALPPREAIARLLPGASHDPLAALVQDVVGQQLVSGLVSTLLWTAAVGIVMGSIAWWLCHRVAAKP